MSAVNDPVSGRRRHESLVWSLKNRAVVNGKLEFRRPFQPVVPTALAHNIWVRVIFVELENN